jgi:hypothetical protein
VREVITKNLIHLNVKNVTLLAQPVTDTGKTNALNVASRILDFGNLDFANAIMGIIRILVTMSVIRVLKIVRLVLVPLTISVKVVMRPKKDYYKIIFVNVNYSSFKIPKKYFLQNKIILS